MVPYDAQDAAEEAAADEGAEEPADDGAADDADGPEGPGQMVGAIAFVIPSTDPSYN